MSRHGWWVPIVWGLLLSGLGLLALLWTADIAAPVALLGAGSAAAATGILVYLADRRRPRAAFADVPLPGISPPSVLLAAAIAVLLVSSYAGLWLFLIGLGMLVVGSIGVAVELGQQWRAGKGGRL
jgi:hypothetical protein